MSASTDDPPDATAEAIAWLLRLREDPGAEAQAGFRLWLEASPSHAGAWGEANRLWDLLGVALITQATPD